MEKSNLAINLSKKTNSWINACAKKSIIETKKYTSSYKQLKYNKHLIKDTIQIADKEVSQTAVNIIKKDNMYTLTDSSGNILSNAFIIKNNDILTIFDLNSKLENKGYGSKLIDIIKKDFLESGKVKHIDLSACWEYGSNPPHIFYIKKGFVPKDENQHQKLLLWIKNGAKNNEFPMDCDCCKMRLTLK